MKLIISLIVAGCFLSSQAVAADSVAANDASDWSGFYLGASLGYAKGDPGGIYDGSEFNPFKFQDIDAHGGTLGAQAGYNWVFGPTVFGLEADVNVSNADGRKYYADTPPQSADVLEFKADYFGSFRARFGIADENNVMVYVTGGVAMAATELSVRDGNSGQNRRRRYVQTGSVVGAGITFPLTENISVKSEYLYHHFGGSKGIAGSFRDADAGDSFSAHKIHLVRIGLSYHF